MRQRSFRAAGAAAQYPAQPDGRRAEPRRNRRHDLWIVADEELVFAGGFTSPLDIESLAERVVVALISKSHAAPGFRSGWRWVAPNSATGCCRFRKPCCSTSGIWV
ncbi:hypothetical protein [Paenirhodobacter sp.]|uniref:hypothetical protein n=1 Tax=Paenirhodobacter sp. TaxID=1965326 RepID=UPI003B50EE8C